VLCSMALPVVVVIGLVGFFDDLFRFEAHCGCLSWCFGELVPLGSRNTFLREKSD
jgi:hypothetical protein